MYIVSLYQHIKNVKQHSHVCDSYCRDSTIANLINGIVEVLLRRVSKNKGYLFKTEFRILFL
jgi:hypothetical protein